MTVKEANNKQIKENGRKENKNIPFDDLLEKLGKFGRYQKILYILIVLPIICHSFPSMSWTFILGKHDHRCAMSELLNDSYQPYGEERTAVNNNSEGDIVVETYSQCTIITNNYHTNITATKKCDRWVYDKSVFQTTVISDVVQHGM